MHTQVFVGFAFSVQAYLMGTHTKHAPLDMFVHWWLFMCMAACAVATFAEAAFPRNFLLSCARNASTIMLGAWFVQISKIMFERE